MSWSLNITDPLDTSREDWREILSDFEPTTTPDYAEGEQHEAVEWAKDMIFNSIMFRVVGNEGDSYRISANGHANPDHKAEGNWSKDMITITIAKVQDAV